MSSTTKLHLVETAIYLASAKTKFKYEVYKEASRDKFHLMVSRVDKGIYQTWAHLDHVQLGEATNTTALAMEEADKHFHQKYLTE